MNAQSKRWLAVTLALVLAAAAALPAEAAGKKSAWQFQAEEDHFSGTDRNYSGGYRYRKTRHPDETPGWTADFAEGFCERFCSGLRVPHGRDPVTTFGWLIGQSYYTPEDIESPVLDPLDRPWAGWLFGGVHWQISGIQPDKKNSSFHRMVQHSFEGRVGVTGAPSLAGTMQIAVHRALDARAPRGWDHQIPFEPTINLNYVYRKRLAPRRKGASAQNWDLKSAVDLVPHFGVNLGTVQTYGSAGGTLRLGRNITGFPPTSLRPTLTFLSSPRAIRPDFEFYAFAGVEGRWMVRNLFLDGSTIGESHSVPKEGFVYDLIAGLSVRFGHSGNWRVSYTHVRRSEESPHPPSQADGIHRFAALTVSFEPLR